MIARLYALAATLAAPGLRLWLRRRRRRGKELLHRLPERWGEDATPRPAGALLWLHAASVGEAVSILPVIDLLARGPEPPFVLLTTGTVTSAALLAERLPGLGGRVAHRFVPLDVPAWAARFVDHWGPDAAGFVEQEVWPNLLAALRRRGVPVLLLNARLSARSAARWQAAPGFAREMFGGFARIMAQTQADAGRLRALGGGVRVSAPGNLKRAAPALPATAGELARLRQAVAGRPAWVAASTHPGEEALVLGAHAQLAARHPGLLTIVAPRHPARGAAVAARATPWPAPRRSAGQDPPAAAGVWVADTIGELGLLYRLAPTVFLGGSLVRHGGQNPLEAARLGCAVAIGPHTENFAEIVAGLADAAALTQVADLDALVAWVGAMLDDPARRARAGEAARIAAAPDPALPRLVADALRAALRGQDGP